MSDSPEIYALGIGRFTPVCMELAEACGYRIAGLYHYDDTRIGETAYGFKIIGSFEDLFSEDDLSGMNFVLTMGSNDIRAEVYGKILARKGNCPNLIHPDAIISRFAQISPRGVHIGPFTYIQSTATVGEDTIVMSHVNISHDSAVGKHCSIAGQSCVSADTILEDYVLFGLGARTIPGRKNHIGEHSIIGAGSLVTGEIPARSVVKGTLTQVLRPEPLVSVICTTFNHEKYVRECLDSILAQECNFPFEILIHDDGSRDNTPQILSEYEKSHPDIIRIFCSHENQSSLGRDPWVDILFPKAHGKFLAICDGDDYWTDTKKLQKQIDILKSDHSLAGCAANISIVDADGQALEERHCVEGGRYTIRDFFAKGVSYPTSTVVLRNSGMSDITRLTHIMKNKYMADWPLWIAAHLQGDFHCIGDALSAYRMSPDSLTHTNARQRRLGLAKDNFRLIRQVLGILPEEYADIRGKLMDKSWMWMELAKAYKHCGKYLRCIYCLIRSKIG